MRVVFFGTPTFAVPSLAALVAAGIDVAAVVTQPDRPTGRSHSVATPPPVKQHALAAGIPVWQPDRPRGDAFAGQLRDARADCAVVVAYGHLLRPDVLAIPRFGFVNVHASMLPRWRGAAPIQWAVLAGDVATGVSIMRIEEGLDSGAVWAMQSTAIDPHDTAGTLFARLADLGARALVDTLPRILAGAQPTAQPNVGVTHAPKIDRATARIDWRESAHAVSCRIRAMDPAPGAWTTLAGAEIKLFGPAVHLDATRPSGERAGVISLDGGSLTVATADGAVEVADVQPAGKRRLSAAEWLRGVRLPDNARFV